MFYKILSEISVSRCLIARLRFSASTEVSEEVFRISKIFYNSNHKGFFILFEHLETFRAHTDSVDSIKKTTA